MRRTIVKTGFASLLWAVAACGNGSDSSGGDETSLSDLIAQRCGLAYNCGCTGNDPQGLDDAKQCRDSQENQTQYDKEAAEAAGLEWDEQCAARESKFWSDVGCGWPDDEDIGNVLCALDCPLWHGDLGPGEACTVVANRAMDCAQGLDCVGGICQDRCNNWRLAEGAKCYDPNDPPTGSCVTGTFCDVGDTNRCQPTPGAGDPCPQGVCEEDLWCNDYAEPEARCESLAEFGAPCETDEACASGYCLGGECGPLPDVGEYCNGECSGDLYCDSGVCTVPQGEGQSCVGLPCGGDLACVDGVCQQGIPWVCYPNF